MKKMYALHTVEELRKSYTEITHAHLKGWGFDFSGDHIQGEIVVPFPDDKAPNLNQLFLVTLEAVDIPNRSDSDAVTKWLQDRRDKDSENPAIKTGRKFR